MEAAEYEKMYDSEEDNWWFQGRRELILDILKKINLDICKDRADILDVGCGTGINLKSFERFGDVVGIDFSIEALRFCKSRGVGPLASASADKLPFKNCSFDIVCALDVLEHIEDDVAALCEISRVLKDGGFLLITVPAFEFLWSNHDVALHHKRRYTKEIILSRLKSSGLSIMMCSYWNFFLFPLVAFIRLLRRNKAEEKSTDLENLPSYLNKILFYILKAERAIINKEFAFPMGVSIVCVCRNGRENEDDSREES